MYVSNTKINNKKSSLEKSFCAQHPSSSTKITDTRRRITNFLCDYLFLIIFQPIQQNQIGFQESWHLKDENKKTF
jgi:hypothetical protein